MFSCLRFWLALDFISQPSSKSTLQFIGLQHMQQCLIIDWYYYNMIDPKLMGLFSSGRIWNHYLSVASRYSGHCLLGSQIMRSIGLWQGFSTFWYPRTPKSKFYPSAYPQIRIVCPSRTPKSKILPKRASFECFFEFRVPPDILSRTPRGTRTPGWEPLVYGIKCIQTDKCKLLFPT